MPTPRNRSPSIAENRAFPSSRDTTSVSYCLQATTAKADLILTDNIGLVSTFELPGTTVNRNEIASLGEIEWPGGQGGENDLSAYGVANCYMVHTAGTYSFRTRRIDNTPIQNIAKADWLWVSRVGASENNELISDISYADGMISFTATANRGNALIAAFDDKEKSYGPGTSG